MTVKRINMCSCKSATQLVWKTFLEYEAPDYSKQGVETFRKSVIDNPSYLGNVVAYGAFDGEKLCGIIATRKEGSHIALFFVDKDYQQRGIGKSLFEKVKEDCTNGYITVNSSPYAVKIYSELGFKKTDTEQVEDGLRFTPMKYEIV